MTGPEHYKAAEEVMTLTDDLRAVEADWPNWHLYLSSTGEIWAVTLCHAARQHHGGSGTTLEAHTTDLMRWEIAQEEHQWLLAPGPVPGPVILAPGQAGGAL